MTLSKATSCRVKSCFLQNGAEMGGATAENAEKKNPGQILVRVAYICFCRGILASEEACVRPSCLLEQFVEEGVECRILAYDGLHDLSVRTYDNLCRESLYAVISEHL